MRSIIFLRLFFFGILNFRIRIPVSRFFNSGIQDKFFDQNLWKQKRNRNSASNGGPRFWNQKSEFPTKNPAERAICTYEESLSCRDGRTTKIIPHCQLVSPHNAMQCYTQHATSMSSKSLPLGTQSAQGVVVIIWWHKCLSNFWSEFFARELVIFALIIIVWSQGISLLLIVGFVASMCFWNIAAWIKFHSLFVGQA
jgi:hypothetical protein